MSIRRVSRFALVIVATMGLSLATAGAAAAKPVGGRIGPNQSFVGLVNGSTGARAHAQIHVACPGPVHSGETTHPLAHQPLEVLPPASAAEASGNTGPDGTHINAYMGIPPTASGAGGIATFTHYGRKRAIPTTLTVPCSGSGYITFMAFPRDPGASRAFVVPVDFVNIAT